MRNKSFLVNLRTSTALAAVLALAACGGGGGSSSSNDEGEVLSQKTTGYDLPTEISAVPANSGGASQKVSGLRGAVKAMQKGVLSAASDLPANSDYKKAQTRKYIEERTLEQFDIIETIMNALAQTHYADEDNINQGPYKAIVAWSESEDGRDVKTLEPWVINSKMIVGTGPDGTDVDINKVLVWIEEIDDETGQPEYIKAEFKIYASATVNEDGSYADYGEWDLNVKFHEDGSEFFAATARIDDDGVTELKINMEETFDEHINGQQVEVTWNPKSVMYRSGGQGYGRVQYPDFDCDQNGCQMVTHSAKYAYNADYLAVQDGNDPVVYKDRNDQTDFTHRYGLFYAVANADEGIAAGDKLDKHKSFGFPLRYTDGNGVSRHAYYGAWQGRHELWGGPDGSGLEAGATVTREDFGPNQNAQQYVVSERFSGTLTKRTLVAGDLGDIQDIAVETWINKHYDLFFDGNASAWKYCAGWVMWPHWDDQLQQQVPAQPTCMNFDGSNGAFAAFNAFDTLVVGENDRKWVGIGRWDNQAMQHIDYVYLASNAGGVNWSGAGFYPAEWGQNGQRVPAAGSDKYTPADGDNMWIDIGGSIYIEYTGEFGGPTTTTGWVQKTLTSFENWTPTFDENSDSQFSPEVGREYYINSKGANFVVKRKNAADAAGSYDVMVELQTAANPVNYATILPANTAYLRTPWRPEVRYGFVTDPADANFLKLVYLTDDPNTQDVDESAEVTVYTSGEWGLQAYSNNGTANDTSDDAPLKAEFNWEYSENGWGTQQFLCEGDCSLAENYVILSDPIMLQALTVANGAGVDKTLALQYDGWMHGLPDLYWELSKNNWTMTQSISDKVINIPVGTEVTDTDGVQYYVKPLEISVFLNVVTEQAIVDAGDTAPDIALADAVNLDSGMPTFVEHNMGNIPADVVIKYSEGKAVSSQ